MAKRVSIVKNEPCLGKNYTKQFNALLAFTKMVRITQIHYEYINTSHTNTHT